MAQGKKKLYFHSNFVSHPGVVDEKVSSKKDFAKLLKVKKVQNQSNMD